MRRTVRAITGTDSSGGVVWEELLVDDLGQGEFKLVASPGLVLGVAADDVISLDEVGNVSVRRRGGNLVVQVFAPPSVGQQVAPAVIALGGGLDGRAPNLTVYTVPVSVGFHAIEAIFDSLVERHPQAEWYFGNVYEVDGVTPLNWWV